MRKSDIMRMEFIGSEAEVLSASCYAGINGTIMYETKNTFVIGSAGMEKTVPKHCNEFALTYEGERFVIRGSEVLHRPEDRIKKVR